MGRLRLDNQVAEMTLRGVTPLEPYPGSSKPWKCECQECGSIVTPRYYTVVQAGKGGCNVCAKKNAAQHRKKATEVKALKMAEKLKLKPLGQYPGAHKDWTLECLVCHTVTTKKAHTVTIGKGCLKCNAGNASRQKKELAAAPAMAAMRKAGLNPLAPYPGRHSPWNSQCLTCGQIVSPRVNGILSGAQGGCINCGNKKKGQSRAISERDAVDLLQSSSAKPLESYPGANVPWKSLCLKCGLSISPRLANLRSGHGACKRCAMVAADSSYDYFGEAIFYFIENEKLDALKIGIAGKSTRRLAAHKQNGWNIINSIETAYGYQAWYAEGKVLAWLRSTKGLPAHVEEKFMPQGGFTETFEKGKITEKEVWDKVLEEISSPFMPVPQAILDGTAKRKARRTCTLVVDGKPCLNAYLANGFCRKHELAWKTYGDPLFTKKVIFTNITCEVIESGVECGKPVNRKGMCSVHYYRNYVYGDPLTLKRPTPQVLPDKCEIENCKDKPYSLGKCKKHYAASRSKRSQK